MEIKVIAKTESMNKDVKINPLVFAGQCGGVCYMPDTFEKLMEQPDEKHIKRAEGAIINTHLSLFGHEHLTLCISGLPKILAMVLNNIGSYNVSEKSGRYTRMDKIPENESKCYAKWYDIFVKLIKEKYNFMTDNKTSKLAQENARYMSSVFTETTMMYTTSLLDILFIISNINKMKSNGTYFYNRLIGSMNTLRDLLIKMLIDTYGEEVSNKLLQINDMKHDGFTLLCNDEPSWSELNTTFGPTYFTKYEGTFTHLAQAQHHRTLDYVMYFNGEAKSFYVPEILRGTYYEDEWLSDITSLKDIIPQATLVKITETGTFDNFLMKIKERECTCAQLEINKQTILTHELFEQNAFMLTSAQAEKLEGYSSKIRCEFKNRFKCASPCQFKRDERKTRLI